MFLFFFHSELFEMKKECEALKSQVSKVRFTNYKFSVIIKQFKVSKKFIRTKFFFITPQPILQVLSCWELCAALTSNYFPLSSARQAQEGEEESPTSGLPSTDFPSKAIKLLFCQVVVIFCHWYLRMKKNIIFLVKGNGISLYSTGYE